MLNARQSQSYLRARHEGMWRIGGITPLILKFCARWKCAVRFSRTRGRYSCFVQDGSEYPAQYGSFPGVKVPGVNLSLIPYLTDARPHLHDVVQEGLLKQSFLSVLPPVRSYARNSRELLSGSL